MSRTKIMERRSNPHISHHHLVSAAAGGLLGLTAALLLAPKSGHKLRRQISRAFEDFSDRGHDFAEDVYERGHDAASNAMDYAKGSAAHLMSRVSKRPSRSGTSLVVGAISGGILGIATALMLAQREEESTEGFASKLREAGKSAKENLQSFNWMDTAKDIVDTIKTKVSPHNHNGTHHHYEEEEEEGHGFHDLFELASLGFRLWQNIKKKR